MKIILEGLACLGFGIPLFIYSMKQTNNGSKISSVYDFNLLLSSIVMMLGGVVLFYVGLKRF